MSISDLEYLEQRCGYKVYVRHLRNYYGVNEPITKGEAASSGIPFSDIESHGGRTEVQIYDGENLIGEDIAVCSNKENYCRKRGRQIAIGRAIKNAWVINE